MSAPGPQEKLAAYRRQREYDRDRHVIETVAAYESVRPGAVRARRRSA